MKAAEYIQEWCNKNGNSGKDWKEVISDIAPNDVFNFNTILVSYWTTKNVFTAWWYCICGIFDF